MNWVNEGELAGLPGTGRRMESIQVEMINWPGDKILQYEAHVQNYGWMGWTDSPNRAGTEGQSLRIEAVRLRVVPNVIVEEIQYDVHAQDLGWVGWVHQGNMSGTMGQSRRLEALRARLMAMPGAKVEYRVWVEGRGWPKDWTLGPNVAGTTGQRLRIEALQLRLVDSPRHVCYQPYLQEIGWAYWSCDGVDAGEAGSGLRMEAVRMRLADSADPYEPNDRFAEAKGPLVSGAVLRGLFTAPNDWSDYYFFTTSASAPMKGWLWGIPAGADYNLSVYDANGNLVAHSAKVGNDKEEVKVESLPAGRYSVRVYRDSQSGPAATEVYQLCFEFGSGARCIVRPQLTEQEPAGEPMPTPTPLPVE